MNNRIFEYNNRLQLSFPVVDGVLLDPPVDVPNKHQQLLDYIFANDPVTGMPSGDLAMYLGDKTNPEIKAFIESNLLMDSSKSESSDLNLPDDIANKYRGVITDDDIVRFSRNHGESVEEYSDRIRGWFVSEKSRRQSEWQKERLMKYFGES